MKRPFAATLVCLCAWPLLADDKNKKDDDGWVTIFDGKSLDGWKINENEKSWSIVDGAFVAKGDRSHLFYVADEKPFVNFELRVDVMTEKNSNKTTLKKKVLGSKKQVF